MVIYATLFLHENLCYKPIHNMFFEVGEHGSWLQIPYSRIFCLIVRGPKCSGRQHSSTW